MYEADGARAAEEAAREAALRLLGRAREVKRGFTYAGDWFSVQEFIVDDVSVKVIDVDRPITSRRELAEVLKAFYEAERALTQPRPSMKLRAYRAHRAFTCRYSSAIPN